MPDIVDWILKVGLGAIIGAVITAIVNARIARDNRLAARQEQAQAALATLKALAMELRENLELLRAPHVSWRSWVLLRRDALDRATPNLSRLPADVATSITAAAAKLERYNAMARSINVSDHSGPILHTLEKDQLQPQIAEVGAAMKEAVEALDHWLGNERSLT